jgi:hypothetical protein
MTAHCGWCTFPSTGRIRPFRVHRPNWKAECVERCLLRLEGGKDCKVLPILTHYCREAIPLYLLAGHPRLLWWCLWGYASVSWQQRLQIGRSPPWLASMRRNAWKRSPNQMSRKGVA